MQSCWTTITSVLVSSGADNAVLPKCFATLEKKPKCAQGKIECTSFYLFVLLSPKMIWWRLRCSKEYMYIYRYIYTTIRYMYMYIYLYHLSCEPNHVIKPIFHLSVKIKCYPSSANNQWPQNQKVEPRHLSLANTHAQLKAKPELANTWTTSSCVACIHVWHLSEFGGNHPVCRPGLLQSPALLAVCTGGEGGWWSVNSQPENCNWKNMKRSQIWPVRDVVTNHSKGRMEFRWDKALASLCPATNELHSQLTQT